MDRFFFQAEDGIRDHCVTGVQTCALPISSVGDAACRGQSGAQASPTLAEGRIPADHMLGVIGKTRCQGKGEIGRASSRERVKDLELAELIKYEENVMMVTSISLIKQIAVQ